MTQDSDHTSPPTLEQRVQRLEDIEEIKNLKYQYARYCDDRYDADGITSLFVPDGHWIVHGLGGEATGHDEMRAFFEAMRHSIVWAIHLVMAPQVEVAADGRTAVGRFYLLSFSTILRADDPSQKDAVFSTLNYVDRFVKVDGRWLFEELNGTSHQASEWTKGWVQQQWIQ